MAPLEWARTPLEIDEFERTLESKGSCVSVNNRSTIFLVLLILINFASFLLSGIQSYGARELPSSFNESFYIAVSNFIILEAFLVGVPLLYVLNLNNTGAFMAVDCWVVATVALAVLLPMFIPKLVPRDETSRTRTVSLRKDRKSSASTFLTNYRTSAVNS